MRILPEESIAVIIDIQEKLFPRMHDNEILLQNTRKLIEGLKILSVPMVVTQQYTRGLGMTIAPVINCIPGFEYVEKISFSCCDEPSFIEKIIHPERKNIIICGIESHVCVLQTCIDLIRKDLSPIVIEDCISSRNLNDKKIALQRMSSEGAVFSTCESILFELLRGADNKVFKDISGLLK